MSSRSFSMFVAGILVVGAVGAEAHQVTRPDGPAVLTGGVIASGFAGTAGAQSGDLADKVKAALKADSDLSGPSEAVTVTAAGSVVTLDGTAPTVQVRAKIAELVMKVDGVTKVVNKIKLAKK